MILADLTAYVHDVWGMFVIPHMDFGAHFGTKKKNNISALRDPSHEVSLTQTWLLPFSQMLNMYVISSRLLS
jgi:hypothetical protein